MSKNIQQTDIQPYQSPYFRIPHQLFDDPLFYGARSKHQYIYIQLIRLAAFRPIQHNIKGVLIDLLPGQLCYSIRQLAEIMEPDISRHDIHGAIGYFVRCKILGQRIIKQKNVLTITHASFCDMINTSARTALGQHSDTKEEYKNHKKSNIPGSCVDLTSTHTPGARVCFFLSSVPGLSASSIERLSAEFSSEQLAAAMRSATREGVVLTNPESYLHAAASGIRESEQKKCQPKALAAIPAPVEERKPEKKTEPMLESNCQLAKRIKSRCKPLLEQFRIRFMIDGNFCSILTQDYEMIGEPISMRQSEGVFCQQIESALRKQGCWSFEEEVS